ncbi:hypothetical protein [Paraburkholderia sp. JHI869]|uniref:hypothetical protein n=1 Tax=Paraburkholderia sp. JHI869 TaxID=3112959 RepID=UPI00317EC4E1
MRWQQAQRQEHAWPQAVMSTEVRSRQGNMSFDPSHLCAWAPWLPKDWPKRIIEEYREREWTPARAKRGKPVQINGSIDSRRGKTTIDAVVAYQQAPGLTDSAPERLQSGNTIRYFGRRASGVGATSQPTSHLALVGTFWSLGAQVW